VICARDEASNLAVNLPGVLVQNYRSTHEVLLVNDNSQDETKYLLEGLHKQFRQLNVIELKQEAKLIPGKKSPLPMGIKASKYEVVLLTDADCIPASKEWLKNMQDNFTGQKEIGLGYGAVAKAKGLLNRIIRADVFMIALRYFSFALAGMPYMGTGRNLAYRKSLFFRNKGFANHNHILSGDDDLFVNETATKNNVAIEISKPSFTYTAAPKNFSTWFFKAL